LSPTSAAIGGHELAISRARLAKPSSSGTVPPGFYNKTPLVPPSAGLKKSTYQRAQHVYLIDHVVMDAKGNFTGIVVRNPCGGYFTITDYARIFFCISWAGTEEPQAE
jgi:hypothetical protein